ncbi:MAG: NUDIX hydrolase [Minisyncoccota bacterium]
MTTEPNHNSVVVVWRRGKDGRSVEFLVMNSIPTNPQFPKDLQVKFPGGGVEGIETPEETARRELKEETGFRVRGKTIVHRVYRSESNGHTKYGFVVNREGCRGSLRKVLLDEGDSILYPPKWVKVSEVLAVIHQHPKNKSHLYIGIAACEYVAKELGVPIESVFD